MKRGLAFLFLVLILINFTFVLAVDQPSTGVNVGDSDINTIQNYTNQIPIGDDGQLDKGKVNQTLSKAEIRINAFNQYIKDNADWLDAIFGMVPQISWLFAINLYFMLLAFTILVLNKFPGDLFFSEGIATVLGILAFIMLLVSKAMVGLAQVVYNIIFEYGWLVIIITVIVCILLLAFISKIVQAIRKWSENRKEKSAKEQTDTDRQVIHKTAEGTLGRKL